MNNWDKITLFKFQQVDEINNRKGISDIDRLLFTTCVVFNLTEYQLDNTPLKQAQKLIDKVSEIFSSEFNPPPQKKIGKYKMNYDPAKLTFGQYIDLSFFLQSKPIQTAHYVLASMADKDAEKHKQRAEYFLYQPIRKVVGSIALFIERFVVFNNEYKDLFGLDSEVTGQEAKVDFFNKRYGWLYSASQIAEYERISLEQALSLPIRQAFSGLGFLKAKAKYDHEQLKRK